MIDKDDYFVKFYPGMENSGSLSIVKDHERGHVRTSILAARKANSQLENVWGYGHSCMSDSAAHREAEENLTREKRNFESEFFRLTDDAQNEHDSYVDHNLINLSNQRAFDQGRWAPPIISKWVFGVYTAGIIK